MSQRVGKRRLRDILDDRVGGELSDVTRSATVAALQAGLVCFPI